MSIPQTNFNPPFNITRASHLVLTAQDLPASRDSTPKCSASW